MPVSGESQAAGWVDLVVADAGDACVFWSGRSPRDRGVYRTRLSPTGQIVELDGLVDPLGVFPAAHLDQAGNVQLVWWQSTSPDASAIIWASVRPDSSSALAALALYRRRPGAGPLTSYLVFAFVSGWAAVLALFYYLLPRL